MKPVVPLVSVVIPTYNRARDLERALKSVLAQTYSNWEILVVDNHSSDNTADVVARFNEPRAKLYCIHNQGVIAASRNLGIRHAQGEYIAFLDSDDWWMPRKLEKSLRYLEEGADIVYHDLLLATKPGQRFFWRKVRTRDLQSPAFEDLILNGNALNTSSVVARKRILQKIGGMSEDLSLITMEDYDAWLRVARVTERIKRIPETLGYYWGGGGNSSNPERHLKCLEAFEERYAVEIRRFSADAGILWLNYSKGRAHYRLGAYAAAKRILRGNAWQQTSLPVAIKVVWMNLILNLFH